MFGFENIHDLLIGPVSLHPRKSKNELLPLLQEVPLDPEVRECLDFPIDGLSAQLQVKDGLRGLHI